MHTHTEQGEKINRWNKTQKSKEERLEKEGIDPTASPLLTVRSTI